MNVSRRDLKEELRDPEYRQAYADDYLNTYVATQIQVLREQRGLSQWELANLIGTKQPGISRLENVNHSSWKTDTLKKIAHALGVRLKISFETYGDLWRESRLFGRESLQRPAFADDPVFNPMVGQQEIVPNYAMASLPGIGEVPGQSVCRLVSTSTASSISGLREGLHDSVIWRMPPSQGESGVLLNLVGESVRQSPAA
jgi:transcriptional regulator with XRE-family HTH domain